MRVNNSEKKTTGFEVGNGEKSEELASIVCHNVVEICEYNKWMKNKFFVISGILLLIYRYEQEAAVRVVCCEKSIEEIQYGVYFADFEHIKTYHDIMKECERNFSTTLPEQGNARLPILIEFVDEIYSKKCLRDEEEMADLLIIISKGTTKINVEIKSIEQKYFNILEHLENIWKAGWKNIEVKINDIKMLSKNEVFEQLVLWNNTEHEFEKNRCIHQIFEQKVEEFPNQKAVIYNGTFETYLSLNEKANQIARYIKNIWKGGEKIVALYIEKNINMVTCILAILKAGFAYLPIDSHYPPQRINYMLTDSHAPIIITEQNLKKNIKEVSYSHIICVDAEKENIEKYRKSNLDICVSPKDTAYIIYTSGSTGNPKGVVLNHIGRVNNFSDFNERFKIDKSDSILSVSSLGFDMCAYDVLGTLMIGGAIILPDVELALQPFHWLTLIEKYHITIWHSVPSLLDLLCKCKKARKNRSIESLRLVLLGGDWIPLTLPEKFREFNKKSVLISLGGATEVSMDSIIYSIEKVKKEWVSIPYGKPMYNQTAYILDKNLNLLPKGVIGELYIGGIGVADGYYRRDGLTKERFLDFQYEGIKDRVYKTGDLVKYLEDGCIQLIGRSDFQVKIDGVRIELGEIEKAINECDGVSKTICIATENQLGKKRIVSFVVSKQVVKDQELWIKDIKNKLIKRFVKQFVPEKFILLEEIPTTPNGKIDRKKLQDIAKRTYYEKLTIN